MILTENCLKTTKQIAFTSRCFIRIADFPQMPQLTANECSGRNKDVYGAETRWGEMATQNKYAMMEIYERVSCRVKYRSECSNNDNEFLLMLIEFDVRRKKHAIIAMKLKV